MKLWHPEILVERTSLAWFFHERSGATTQRGRAIVTTWPSWPKMTIAPCILWPLMTPDAALPLRFLISFAGVKVCSLERRFVRLNPGLFTNSRNIRSSPPFSSGFPVCLKKSEDWVMEHDAESIHRWIPCDQRRSIWIPSHHFSADSHEEMYRVGR